MNLDKLNSYQKEAVLDQSRACIVNANVGSGKTTVLISKIIYLHEKMNVDYKDMLVLTFTNKAADEIKERLVQQGGKCENSQKDEELQIDELHTFGTFHSVALHYLREYLPVEQLGFTKDFQVIEPEEELEMALQLIKEQKLTIKYKNRLKKRLEQEQFNRYQDDIEQLRELIVQEKKNQNKMTFSDLLQYTVKLIKMCDLNQLNLLCPQWIIIDEVQDSDSIQLEMIDVLMSEKTSLFAVGDPNQIIYSWRGSEASVFRKLKEKYDAHELELPVNYRSNHYILELAKRFQQNRSELKGVREQGNKIIVRKQYDSFQEADYLSDRIQAIHQSGVPYKEIAVFYRLQSQSEVFEKVFAKNQIPYEVSLKKTIHDIPVLEWMMKLFRAAVNPKDRYATDFVIGHKVYGPGKNKKQKESLLEKLGQFQEFCKCNQENISIDDIYEFFDFDQYLHPTSAEYQNDRNAVYELLERINAYTKERNMSSMEGLTDFINSSALYGINILQKEINSEDDSVKLMTLHASKGLEFSYVFIVGINYGLIPLRGRTFEDEDEERRLFFVGITRAKDHLELSYYENPDVPRSVSGPSPFIKVLPKQLIEVGGQSDGNHTETLEGLFEENRPKVDLHELKKQIVIHQQNAAIAFQSIANAEPKSEPKTTSEPELQTEQKSLKKASHKKYGIGTIIKEDDFMVTVEFEGYGAKEFMKGFGDIEILE